MKNILAKLLRANNLSAAEMTAAMHSILDQQATPSQIGAFLMGLRMKGETVTELTAATEVLRQKVTAVVTDRAPLVDIVGTGGDLAHTFNISTAAAFVVAAAGGVVAKHGNRSVSSQCGSADVLEAAGANLNLTPDQIARCIQQTGIGFMFAPLHHPAMQSVQAFRRELGFRTLFNLLGPLTNPANAKHQLLGVFAREWLMPFAEVCQNLGSRHTLIVHSHDGLDEISLAAPTEIVELKDGVLSTYDIHPEEFGIAVQSLDALQVENTADSLLLLQSALNNAAGPARDIVLLNAGAAIYAADVAKSLADGMALAKAALQNRAALAKFSEFIAFTQQFKG